MITLTEAKRIVGSIAFPSKMPGSAYDLSAHDCIAGKKLAAIPGSICSNCYALRSIMSWSNVQATYQRRLRSITDPKWVEAMTRLLRHLHRGPIRVDLGIVGVRLQQAGGQRHRYNEPGYHRWHGSGDLQSVEHLAKIVEVCRRTPHIKHWLPTRELAILRAWDGEVPPNLTIRVSATMLDGSAPKGWDQTSTVHSRTPPADAHECPAYKQEHRCKDCRACWSRDVAVVSYLQH